MGTKTAGKKSAAAERLGGVPVGMAVAGSELAERAPAEVELEDLSADLEAEVTPDFQMEGDAVESFIKDKRIGLRIRALRQKNGMGLVDLGLHVGLSASFLSQLETGRVVPTLRNLARIAMVFSKDLSYFFDPGPRTLFRVHKRAERVRLPQSGVDDPMYFFESLGYLVPDRQMDPYLAEFQPKAGRTSRAHQHAGSEFLYVLKGELCIQHGEQSYELETGDSVYFDSSTTHSYSCVGDEPATAVIVTLQQAMESQGFRGSKPRGPVAVVAERKPVQRRM